MKKLLIGLTLLASVSAFATSNDLLETISSDLELEYGQRMTLATFSSCIYGAVDIPAWEVTCDKKIPKLLSMGLTEKQIKMVVIDSVNDRDIKEGLNQKEDETELRIKNFIDRVINH